MKCVCGHDELIDRLRKNVTSQSPEYVKAVVDLSDCNDALRAHIAAMREALVALNFKRGACEICGEEKYPDRRGGPLVERHAPDCSYAALLKESEE